MYPHCSGDYRTGWMDRCVALWPSGHCRGLLRLGSSSNPGLKHTKSTEINVVVKKSAQLEDVLLRSLPRSAEPGLVTSHTQQLLPSMLGNASKIPEIKCPSRAEERAAGSANLPNPSSCLPNHKPPLPRPQFWTNEIQRRPWLWRSARYG